MTDLRRDIQDGDGNFVKRIELERVSPSEVIYRRFVPPDMETPVEERRASRSEARPLVDREQQRQQRDVTAGVKGSIVEMQKIQRGGDAMTNAELSQAVRAIARAVTNLLRMAVREWT